MHNSMKFKTPLTFIIVISLSLTLLSFVPSFHSSTTLKEIDFGTSKGGQDWKVMNDGVMGGLSSGAASLNENSLTLKGIISLANNGGFASIRSRWGNYDLSDYTEVTIRYRSIGQVVALSFETSRMWWLPYYLLDLAPTDNNWKTVTIPIDKANQISIVQPTGKQLSSKQLNNILRVGFMAHEKKEIPFEFEVDFVRFE